MSCLYTVPTDPDNRKKHSYGRAWPEQTKQVERCREDTKKKKRTVWITGSIIICSIFFYPFIIYHSSLSFLILFRPLLSGWFRSVLSWIDEPGCL